MKKYIALLLLLSIQANARLPGDFNEDGVIDVSDVVSLLQDLFKGNEINCLSCANINGDSETDISDAIYLLRFLFDQGAPPQGAPRTLPATVSWDPVTVNSDGTPITDLAGYKLYYGTAPSVYSNTETIILGERFHFDALPCGVYYFAVSAFDTSGNESVLSQEVKAEIQ